MEKFGHLRNTSYLCDAVSPSAWDWQAAFGTIRTLSSVCSEGHELRNFYHPKTDSNEASAQCVLQAYTVYAPTICTGVGYPVVYPWVEGNAKARDQKDRRR